MFGLSWPFSGNAEKKTRSTGEVNVTFCNVAVNLRRLLYVFVDLKAAKPAETCCNEY
jgi:hypothetical protein